MNTNTLPKLASNPVFVIGAHKSGSSYLRSLLDGHPELTVIPIEAHFFKHANYWIDYSFRRNRPVGKHDFIASATNELKAYTNEDNPFSDFTERQVANLDKFLEIMNSNHLENERHLFERYVQALIGTFNINGDKHNSTKLRIVEKSVENAEFVPDLKRLFPDARFIHIIRNPYDNLSSFRRYRQKIEGKYPRIDRMVLSLNNHYHNLDRNLRNIDNYLVIKYEDLVESPKPQMKKIAEHIEVEFSDILLKPTANGRRWKGNTTRSGHELDDVKELEIFYVNKLFKSILDTHGYEKRNFSGRYWRRVKSEPLKNYLFNRFIRYSL